ncbi:glycosyltransferase [Gammaproteobacteria bacterium]|nr:glycosyltransferase [Gammaproteobacteria bacterium]
MNRESIPIKLSVIMSVYDKEEPLYLERALYSIWNEQFLKPDQIVLVKNGPLTIDLDNILKKWANLIPGILLIINLEENLGFARALNIALAASKGDYIARMDTDDISTSDRFAKQVTFLKTNKTIDVVGTQISEINEHENIIKDIVKYPTNHEDLLNFFSRRDPIAHPSAMFRYSFFKKAGIYSESHPLFEDTYLWFLGFKSGCKFSNIDSVCLKYRRSKSFYKRRGDGAKAVRLLRVRLFKINRELNFNFLSDVYAILYFIMSLLPSKIKKIAYQYFR